VITSKGIEWEDKPIFNQTVIGDPEWRDYAVGCDIFFPEVYSYATLLVRATEMNRSHAPADGYILRLQSSGKWELMAGKKRLSTGVAALEISAWQNLRLQVKGTEIRAYLNEKEIVSLSDTTFRKGMAGVGCSFDRVEFDNFQVTK
jgi:galactosylceramidase